MGVGRGEAPNGPFFLNVVHKNAKEFGNEARLGRELERGVVTFLDDVDQDLFHWAV